MKNHFASTASTITAALLLLLLSECAHGGSLVVLNDEDIASRHNSVQTRTCEGGVAVTGEGEFSMLDSLDVSFSSHVCVEDHNSSNSEGGGAAMAPGSVRVVSGKIFNSAKQVGMTYEYFYHAHCMYMDEEGGVFVGVEVQELTGDRADGMNQKEDEGEDNDRKLKAEKGLKKSKKSKNLESEKGLKKSKKSKNSCPPECVFNGICDDCCVGFLSVPGGRKLIHDDCCVGFLSVPGGRKLIHANEEVTSGNEPKGTLGIFYFQRKEDFTEDHARYGVSFFDEFDTACSDFADAVSRTDMMITSKVTQGGFLFKEPL